MKDATLATTGQILWRLIEHHGLEPEPLFRAAGIDPQIIHDPRAHIDRAKGERLIRALAGRIPDPAFGLQAAQCWHPSNLAALGYAWLSSSTLRTAFKRLVRYWRIVTADVAVRLEESPDGIEFVHLPPALDAAIDAIRGDMVMAILVAMCRANFGAALNPRRVALQRAAPAEPGPYPALFGCPVRFGADANRLSIGLAEADHPLPTGNRDLAAMHDRALVEQLARLDKKDVMARCRASLLERMTSGDLSEDNLARDLNMSRRSLQRRLAEAEATYQSLVDETRRDMALRYLEDPGKSATDIAFLLGYSQQSAFTRAFRRWTGKSPSAYRSSKAPATA